MTLHTCRLGRLFCCLLALALAASACFAADPNKTVVSDTLYRADGTAASGTLLISWPAFISADGKPVAAGSMTVRIGPNGQVNIPLVPTQSATPAGSYYKVVLKLDDGASSTEYWAVPTLSPTTIAAIRSSVVPASVAMQVVSREYVDAADAAGVHKNGNETIAGVKTFVASPLVPAPAAEGAAANKGYVDAAVATGGGNILALNRGGTGNSSWTPARCVRVAADGSQLESAPADCGSGANSDSDTVDGFHASELRNALSLAGNPLNAAAPSLGQQLSFDGTNWSVQSKPAVDVRDYASLQAAITAANGGMVMVPEGVYTGVISAIPSNTSVWCASRKSIITIANGANATVVTVATGAASVAIRNCTIDGNAANQSAGNYYGIKTDNVDGLVIDNVEVRNTKHYGIMPAASVAANHLRITNSYIHDVGTQAIQLRAVQNAVISNNIFSAWGVVTSANPAIGISTGGTVPSPVNNYNLVITDNVFQNTVGTQFAIESASGSWSNVVDGCTISGNLFDGNGLMANGVSGWFFNCSMTGNAHVNGAGNHRSGYEIVGTNNLISGNSIKNGTIAVNGSSGGTTSQITVTGNEITNDGVLGVGIALGGGAGFLVTDVTISANNISMTNATPQSAIYLGTYGASVQINRISVTGNKAYGPGAAGNGIRLLDASGSSDIFVSGNVAKGFANGWVDGANNFSDEVTVTNNDFRGNTNPINHGATGGTYRVWGNVTADDQTSFDVPKISGVTDSGEVVNLHAATATALAAGADRTKLDGIAAGATVGADWNTNVSNKPALGTAAAKDVLGTGTKVASTSATAPAGNKCVEFDTSGNLVIAGSNAACGSGGSMTWPGTAGIVLYGGSNTWGTSIGWNSGTATATMNVTGNASGTAAGLAAQYVDWAAVSGGNSIANKPTLPANESGTASNFLSAYNSATGAWTKSRPSCTTLSDAGAACSAAASTTVNSQTCALGGSCTVTADPTSAKYKSAICGGQLGDGSNPIPAGTYVIVDCYNDFGATYTISAIRAYSDNNGTSTVNAAVDTGTALLTGAVTATASFASGTQSATTTIATNHWIKFTLVADGTSKQIVYQVTTTR